nr:zinc finger, CCHC-type [Tanacetum cinerariifolium]
NISRQFSADISNYRDATLEECGHRDLSVREYPSRALVVCTMNSRDHYARVLRHTHFNLFKRLRDEILNSGSKSKEVPMNLIVVPENGKGSFHFTSASNAAKKMMEIAASGMQQPKEAEGKRKREDPEGKKSAKAQKYHHDTPDVSVSSDEQESSEEERSDEDEEPKTAKKNLDKFEGVNFRRWQKNMHFLLFSMSVVYVRSTPMPEDGGDNLTVEQASKRAKWDNDDYVYRGLILN